ncbi:AGE family epimerase/isomerase [Mesorhizobium atlanticum]
MLEAFLTPAHGDGRARLSAPRRAIIDLFRSHFFDAESWTVGEYFDKGWKPGRG